MTRTTKLRTSMALAAITALISVAVTSAAGTKAIQERHEAMEQIGESMGALAAMAKKKAPFDVEVVASNARTIEAQLKKAVDLFPKGSETGDVETWAKPEIWSDRENFDKIFQSGIAAAVALQSVEEEAAYMPALGALGNSCKSCHDKYRRPKK